VLYDVKIYSPLRQALIDDEDEQTGGRDVNRVSVRGKLALGYEDVLSAYTDDDFNGPGVYYLGSRPTPCSRTTRPRRSRSPCRCE